MESTVFTKTQLREMNNSHLGHNWIKNIENITHNQRAKIYPTWEAGISTGRIYVALPVELAISEEAKNQWNIM
jgi:hypothetical protein